MFPYITTWIWSVHGIIDIKYLCAVQDLTHYEYGGWQYEQRYRFVKSPYTFISPRYHTWTMIESSKIYLGTIVAPNSIDITA